VTGSLNIYIYIWQVTGSLNKPFHDSSALLRFHEDERQVTAVNCRSL
jgi:hypothetical protein